MTQSSEVGDGCARWSKGGSTTMRSPATVDAWTNSALRCNASGSGSFGLAAKRAIAGPGIGCVV